MSAITETTTIEEHILAFAKYAKSSDDEAIKKASDNLLLFFEANKNKIDLNKGNIFEEIYFQETDKSESNDFYKISNYQFFSEFSNCYDKLKNNYLNEEEATAEFRKKAENIKEIEQNFPKLEKEFNVNCEFKNTKEELQKEISEIKSGFTKPQDIKFDDLFENFKLKVQPQEMIEFINDKKQNEFPFKNQDTLKNPKFMRSFYKEMLSKSNSEIQDMINKVREKNRILQNEINEFKKEKTDLLTKLDQELNTNKNLSTINENKEEILSTELAMNEIVEKQKTDDKQEAMQKTDEKISENLQKDMQEIQEVSDIKTNNIKKRYR